MCEQLTWKVQSSQTNGANKLEIASVAVDPWTLLASKMLSLRLATDGWRPVMPADAEATGAGAGWAQLTRIVSRTNEGCSERYSLTGSIAFLNADRNIALYVELISGKVEQRMTVDAALEHVGAFPAGLRWLGGIVPSGPNLKGRIARIEREVASLCRRFVPATGWVQVPFFTRSGVLRMSETKIKAILCPEPVRQRPRAGKVVLQIMARTGQWRSIQARPVEVTASGVLVVGPHAFAAAEEGGYIYLTATGAISPTYRLPLAEYNKLKEDARVEKAFR